MSHELLTRLEKAVQELDQGRFQRWGDLGGKSALLRSVLRWAVASHDPQVAGRLEGILQILTQASLDNSIANYCSITYKGVVIHSSRLHRNACALVATALAAMAAQVAVREQEALPPLLGFLDQAMHLLGENSPPPTDPATISWFQPSPEGLVHQACDFLADPLGAAVRGRRRYVEAARVWTLSWWNIHRPPQGPIQRIPVAGWSGSPGTGFLAQLLLTPLSTQPGVLIEDPEQALRPLGTSLIGALGQAWAPWGHDGLWSLTEVGAGSKSLTDYLDGGSLGGAAAAGFECLRRRSVYDPHCLIMASLGPQGRYLGVGGETDKVEAARRHEIRRFGFARGNPEPYVPGTSFTEAQREALRVEGLTPALLDNVHDATDFASNRITDLLRYLDTVSEAADAPDQRPVYLGGRSYSHLYIPPHLFLLERKKPQDEQEREERQRSRTRISPEDQDLDENAIFQEERTQERELTWDEVLQQLDQDGARAVVLGSPGQGKSLLTQFTARRLVRAARQRWEEIQNLDEAVLPLVIPLNALVGAPFTTSDPEKELRQRLAQALEKTTGCTTETAQSLAAQAHENRFWLLLDALDEVTLVPGTQASPLKTLYSILEKSAWRCRVLITSRPYGYRERGPETPWPEYRLALFSPDQQETFLQAWFPSDAPPDSPTQPLGKQRLQKLRQQNRVAASLARNPFLLTLLCALAEDKDLDPAITRTELYEETLIRMLGGATSAETWRPVLEDLALDAFLRDPRNLHISERFLRERLRSSFSKGDLDVSDDRLKELLKARVLIRVPAADAYTFSHRSLGEFYAGGALATPINRDGWKSACRKIRGKDQPYPCRYVVDRKAWLASWHEALIFLAGQLDDPSPFLRLLAKADRDDVFRHRLPLAVRGLEEIRPSRIRPFRELGDEIATEAFLLWWEHATKGGVDAIEALISVLPVLGRWNGVLTQELPRSTHEGTAPERRISVKGLRLLPALPQSILQGGDAAWCAAEALCRLGESVATPEVLVGLAQCIAQGGDSARYAVSVVGKLGNSAVTPEFLAALAQCIAQAGDGVGYAVSAVGKLGWSAATPEFLAGLAQCIAQGGDAAGPAVSAIGELGNSAATPEFLAALAQCIAQAGDGVGYAVSAVGKLGWSAATPEFLAGLAQCIAQGGDAAGPAVSAIGELGRSAATPEILAALAQCIAQGGKPALGAVDAINQLGVYAVTPKFLAATLKCISNEVNAGEPAVFSMSKLGFFAATPEFLAALAKCIARGGKAAVGAVTAVSELGVSAATPEILAALAKCIAQGRKPAYTAVSAVAKMGVSAATPEFLTALAQCIAQGGKAALGAVDAINQLGVSAGTPEFLVAMAQCIAHGGKAAESAVSAVGELGKSAATPEFLIALAHCIAQGGDAAGPAADAVGKLGVSAATPEILTALAHCIAQGGDAAGRAVSAVGELGVRSATPEILAAIAKCIAQGRKAAERAAYAVGKLGVSAATPKFLADLTQCIALGGMAAWHAIDAISQLGVSVTTPEFLNALAQCIAHGGKAAERAVSAVGELGEAAATPEILVALAQYMTQEGYAAYSAVSAVGELGNSAATPEFLAAMAQCISQGGIAAWHAVSAVGKLGVSAATPEILAAIAPSIAQGGEVAEHAAEAVGKMGASAATPKILVALTLCMAKGGYAAYSAVSAISGFGASAATPEILAAMAQCIAQGGMAAWYAVGAISQLGVSATDPEFLTALAQCIAQGGEAAGRAADAVGELGVSAATPEILAALAQCIAQGGMAAWHAVDAINQLGISATTPEILAALAQCIAQGGKAAGRAADAVGKLGVSAATPGILAAMAHCIAQGGDVAEHAVDAVGQLGVSAATPEFLAAMTLCIAQEEKCSWSAGRLFELFHSQGYRCYHDPKASQYTLRHVDVLSFDRRLDPVEMTPRGKP